MIGQKQAEHLLGNCATLAETRPEPCNRAALLDCKSHHSERLRAGHPPEPALALEASLAAPQILRCDHRTFLNFASVAAHGMVESEASVRALARRLPKAQLHLHLDGSLPESFFSSHSPSLSIPLPCPSSSLRAHLLSQKAAAFLKNGNSQPKGGNWDVFTFCNRFLQTAPLLTEAAETVVFHLVAGCNCRVVEIRFCPALHTQQGLSQDDAVRAVVSGFTTAVARAQRRVRGGVLLCALRSYPTSHVAETAALAERWMGRGVVGLDLAGDEASYLLAIHERPLREVAVAVPLTLHAGEWGAHGRGNLKLAVDIGARRVGHALALRGDDGMLKMVRERGVYVEACVTANCSGGNKVPADRFHLHPVKEMVEKGVKVAGFNCDNLLLSGTVKNRPDPTEEIVRARLGCGLAWMQIRQVLISGASASFDDMGSAEERDDFVKEFAAEVDAVLVDVVEMA